MLEKQGFKPGASADEQAYADLIAKQQTGLGEATSAKERANMAKAFLKMGANPRGFLPGAIEGAESYITGAGEIAAGKEARETALAEAKSKYSAGLRARAAGDMATSDKLFHEAAQLENQAKIAAGNNAATLGAASIHAAATKAPYAMVEREKEQIRAELKAKLGREPETTEVLAAYNTALNKTADTTIQGQIETALAKNKTYEMLSLQLANPDLDPKQKEKLKAEQKAIYDDIVARISKGSSQTTASTAPQAGGPMYATNGKERIVSTDGGKTWNPVKG
jgi:primosomal protein N'